MDPQTVAERQREKVLRSAADARRAERAALEADLELRRVKRELSRVNGLLHDERARHARFRQRRAVRLAVAVTMRLRLIARRISALRYGGDAWRPAPALAGAPWAAHPARTHSALDPAARSVAAAYRSELLAALLEPATPAGRLRVAIAAPARHLGADDAAAALSTALAGRGFEVFRTVPSAPDWRSLDGADVVVATDPSIDPVGLPLGPIRVGWNVPDEKSAEWDLIVNSGDQPARAFAEAVERWLRATRVSIRVPSGSARTAETWGDTFLARDLRAAFRSAGWPTRIHYHDRWDDPAIGHDDVTVDLLGMYEPTTRRGACRVLWQVSHPELASPDLYRAYDVVFVASEPFARLMAEQVEVPVHPLHQAADPARFRTEPTGPPHELLFVANWRSGRPILGDLLPTDHELAVYGRGWTPERLDPARLAGESVPNDVLGGYYAAAGIVLNDHAPGMRREGFLSNRLYDACAAGALVVSDEVDGLDEEFDGAVVAYRDRHHLHELIDAYLADPDERRRRGARGRQAVLDRHTFGHRARAIMETVEPCLRDAGTDQSVR